MGCKENWWEGKRWSESAAEAPATQNVRTTWPGACNGECMGGRTGVKVEGREWKYYTYIPVQPNLQPKPQAERTSGRKKGRKKERKHNNVSECQSEKEKLHWYNGSLNRTCRKKHDLKLRIRLNRKDTSKCKKTCSQKKGHFYNLILLWNPN